MSNIRSEEGIVVKTADLCDEFLSELQVCQLPMQSYGGKKEFSGPIATVEVFEDNVLVREALETVPAGTVLVVDGKKKEFRQRCQIYVARRGLW